MLNFKTFFPALIKEGYLLSLQFILNMELTFKCSRIIIHYFTLLSLFKGTLMQFENLRISLSSYKNNMLKISH